jgi:hypothetical protein
LAGERVPADCGSMWPSGSHKSQQSLATHYAQGVQCFAAGVTGRVRAASMLLPKEPKSGAARLTTPYQQRTVNFSITSQAGLSEF